MSEPSNPPLFEKTFDGDQECPADPTLCTKITLRDLFAAFALAGQIANPKWPNCGPSGLPAPEDECAAHWAYCFADAMLEERARQ